MLNIRDVSMDERFDPSVSILVDFELLINNHNNF